MIHLHSILRTAFSTLVLVAGGSCVVMNEAKADWSAGADTLTFDNSSYQLYLDKRSTSGTFVPYTTGNGASGSYGGVNYSSGVFTPGDDRAVPYDAWFKVDNGGSPVYIRMAFDRSPGTTGSIDSGDIPVVFEDTSRNTDVDATYNLQYKYNDSSPADSSGSNPTTMLLTINCILLASQAAQLDFGLGTITLVDLPYPPKTRHTRASSTSTVWVQQVTSLQVLPHCSLLVTLLRFRC